MPTYVYKREDGTTFEIEQRITEDPLTTCPTTGQPVTRVITGGTGLIFKGSGFYLTDYARSNGDKKESKEAKDSKDTKDSSSSSESKKAESSAKETPSASSTKSED